MYKIHHSHRGSALIIALIVVVLLTIMTTTFLEKILNLGKVSGGINYSAQSYSVTTSLIEEQLMEEHMTRESPWNIVPVSSGYTYSGKSLTAATGGTIMPVVGKGNSLFDPDWNMISMGEPIQIVIPEHVSWGSVNFYFRVPNIAGASNTGALHGGSGVILWTFGYSGASLYASGESNIFKGSQIDGGDHLISDFSGVTNSGSDARFDIFYTDSTIGVGDNGEKCTASYQCTLKLSMIRPFLTSGLQSFPFLEYRIDFGLGTNIPSQYMVIDSSANMYGFLRSRQVRIPQITTSTAADFAILQ